MLILSTSLLIFVLIIFLTKSLNILFYIKYFSYMKSKKVIKVFFTIIKVVIEYFFDFFDSIVDCISMCICFFRNSLYAAIVF